jgi:hypothetical protein
MADGVSSTPRTALSRATGALLLALMALGSVALWIVVPVGALWVASQLQADSARPTFGPYLAALAMLAVGTLVLGKCLAALDRAYCRRTNRLDSSPTQAPWLASLRGDRAPKRRATVLAPVMVISVTAAACAAAVWFLTVGHFTLPGG